MPYKRFTKAYDDFPSIISVFDGARLDEVPSDESENPMVDMRAIRGIIDMLEDNEEIRALVYANGFWVNTDVSTMFRWRMEEVTEIGSGEKPIDVEIEEKEQ